MNDAAVGSTPAANDLVPRYGLRPNPIAEMTTASVARGDGEGDFDTSPSSVSIDDQSSAYFDDY
jgi:hypothetical protein